MRTALITAGVIVALGVGGYYLVLKPKVSGLLGGLKSKGGGRGDTGSGSGGWLGSLSRTFSDFSSLSSGLSQVTGSIGGLSSDFGAFGS